MAFQLSDQSLSLINTAAEHGISLRDNVRAMIVNCPMDKCKLSIGKTIIRPNFKAEAKAGMTIGEVFGNSLDSKSVLDKVAEKIQKGGFTATVPLDEEGKKFTINGSEKSGEWAVGLFVQELREGANYDSSAWAQRLILAADAKRLENEDVAEKRLLDSEIASLQSNQSRQTVNV